MPSQIEDYVHRIGRTGRAGNSGTAYTFFTPDNGKLAGDLIKILSEAKQEVNPKLHEIAASSRGMFNRKRYRPSGGSGRGGYGGGGGSYGGGSRSYDKPRNGAYGAQSDGINAMFAQAYQQVAASASGGASGGGGAYTGYQYQ